MSMNKMHSKIASRLRGKDGLVRKDTGGPPATAHRKILVLNLILIVIVFALYTLCLCVYMCI